MREVTVYTALLASAQGFVPDLARQLTLADPILNLGDALAVWNDRATLHQHAHTVAAGQMSSHPNHLDWSAAKDCLAQHMPCCLCLFKYGVPNMWAFTEYLCCAPCTVKC